MINGIFLFYKCLHKTHKHGHVKNNKKNKFKKIITHTPPERLSELFRNPHDLMIGIDVFIFHFQYQTFEYKLHSYIDLTDTQLGDSTDVF